MSKSKDNGEEGGGEIVMRCELCSNKTGIVLKLGDLTEKIPDLDRKEKDYRQGLCAECNEHLKQGGVFFTDRAGRCVKVSLDATKSKISEQFHGKVIQIPASALNELIAAYLEAHPNLPQLGK